MGRVKSMLRDNWGYLATFGVFALVLLLALLRLRGVEENSLERQQEALRQAALRAAVACYSVEGAYPTQVEYLEENYGLRYDRETFIVRYEAFADNILPEIRVLIRGVES